jgi:signal transduction histidine kinase
MPRLVDALFPIAIAVFLCALLTFIGHWQHGVRPLDALGYGLLIGSSAALILRWRLPVVVFVVTTVAVDLYYFLGYPSGPAVLPAVLSLWTLTMVAGPLRATLAGVCVGILALAADAVIPTGHVGLGGHAVGVTVMILVPVSIGTAMRTRRAAAEAARQRADAEVQEQERLRIAREVHDTVAHSLAMINVQAGVAVHVADRRPEQAKEALRAIKDASRLALADLRATLGVLRSGEDRAPAPSLRRMAELVNATTAAGLAVRVAGEPGQLPAPVDVAAYRILQEALTNTVRHALQASTVHVWFGRTDDGLELVVTDDGKGPVNHGQYAGNGLRGMRERVSALGGRLDAGPQEVGGFAVRALLPMPGGAR